MNTRPKCKDFAQASLKYRRTCELALIQLLSKWVGIFVDKEILRKGKEKLPIFIDRPLFKYWNV